MKIFRKSQVAWVLLHRFNLGEPAEFFEVRQHEKAVWTCGGAPLTFGEVENSRFPDIETATAEVDRLVSLKQGQGFEISARGHYAPGAFDFDELRAAVKTASRESFDAVLAAHKDKTICAFGLVTDDVPMTIYAMAQSKEAVDAESDEDFRAEARWNLQAWSLEEGSNHFDIPYRMLLRQSRDDIPFEKELKPDVFAKKAFEAFVSALAELRDEGVFEAAPYSPFALLVEVSDSEPISGMVERLNSDQDILRGYHDFAG